MKYLLLSIAYPTRNIDHALAILARAIAEAIHLDRTLIIGTFAIDAAGNLGYPLKNLNYNHFIDIDKIRIAKITDGNLFDVRASFRYMAAAAFNRSLYTDDEVLLVGNSEPISMQQNSRYKIIMRKITTTDDSDHYTDILVRFSASSTVDALTDNVLRTMGTRLEYVKRLSTIYNAVDYSANQELFQLPCPHYLPYYACLQIQHKQCSQPERNYLRNRCQIRETIERLAMARGTTIYIATDIDDSGYFDFLKNSYSVYRYLDFPQLRTLISDTNTQAINKAMLDSVEKNILRYAFIKVSAFRDLSGFPVIYSNSSHEIPFHYKLSALAEQIKNLLSPTFRG